VPEAFKVLIKELQSLALDIKVLKDDAGEVEIREDLEDVGDLDNILAGDTSLIGESVIQEEDLKDMEIEEETEEDDEFLL